MFNFEIPPLTAAVLGTVVSIFIMRVVGNTASTMRVLVMTRGRKFLAAFLGFFEVSLYALAIAPVINNLSNVWNLLGYGLGFSVGTLVGMWLEERVALGFATIRIVSKENSHQIADTIRNAGYGATVSTGWGREGSVRQVSTTVRRKEIKLIRALAEQVDPVAFITVEEAYGIRRGYMRYVRHER